MRLAFVFREGLRGLGQNITMTIALVITTAISLALRPRVSLLPV